MGDILIAVRDSVSVGDVVRVEELENIYDTLIIVEYADIDDDYGVVRYVGERTPEANKWITSGKIISPVYNDSSEIGADYDE